MITKRYTSYAEIDRDLEILKLEKEINYQKMLLSIQRTKESFSERNLALGLLDYGKSVVTHSLSTALKSVLPILLNWLFRKKRGN